MTVPPAAPTTKAARHARIAGILAGTPVRSQDELAERLADLGVRVTQATLSRDLDEIGAVRLRGPDGGLVYALPPDHPDSLPSGPVGAEGPLPDLSPLFAALATGTVAALGKVAGDLLLTAEASGNLVVLKTPPGAAQLLASMIDRAGVKAVLGTVAGDDTVLIVARDPQGGDELAAALLRLADRRGNSERQVRARNGLRAQEQA